MKNWLDKYNDGGYIQPNNNDSNVSLPPGFKGWGYNTKGDNYNPAWNGPVTRMGGTIPGVTGMMYGRTSGLEPLEPNKAQTGRRLKKSSNPEIREIIRDNIPTNLLSELPTEETIEQIKNNEIQRMLNKRSEVVPYVPQSLASKTLDVATNPMTALGYVARGEDIPDNFTAGPRNATDYALDVINPAQYALDATNLVAGTVKGDLGQIGEGILGIAPLGLEAKNLKKTFTNKNITRKPEQSIENFGPDILYGEDVPVGVRKKLIDKAIENPEFKKLRRDYQEVLQNIKDGETWKYNNPQELLLNIENKGKDLFETDNLISLIPEHQRKTSTMINVNRRELDEFRNSADEVFSLKTPGFHPNEGSYVDFEIPYLNKQHSQSIFTEKNTGKPINTIFDIFSGRQKDFSFPKTHEEALSNINKDLDQYLSKQFYNSFEEHSRINFNDILTKNKNGGVIKDNRGQWAHPGKVTQIDSNNITMQGVPYPVLGISDTGDTKMMQPGEDYKFEGNNVTEYPMAKNGSSLVELNQLTNFTNYNTPQPGGWLDKYN
jgi:hypothetical protein